LVDEEIGKKRLRRERSYNENTGVRIQKLEEDKNEKKNEK